MKILCVEKSKDELLSERVRSRIKWDKRISDADIHIMTRSGQVTLIGKVDSNTKKNAAIETAKATKGVSSVVNQIEVPSSFEREDSELRSLIERRVSEIGLSMMEFINISIKNGIVKLEGVVRSKHKKAHAAGIVWELSGVKDLNNQIRIDAGSLGQKSHTPQIMNTNKATTIPPMMKGH